MANKLITQFTAIANPAGTRLITLGDETTGERFQISIADFFALIDSGAAFSGNVNLGIVNTQGRLSIKQTSGTLTGGITLEADDDTGTAGIFRKSGSSGALTLRNGGQDALQISGDGNGLATFSGDIMQNRTADTFIDHVMNANRTTAGVTLGRLRAEWNGLGVAQIGFLTGPNTIDKDEGEIAFFTHNGTSLGERVRIDKDGFTTFSTLAGTGTRNVVVDANGKMSAP